jgi:hypothetical protein
LAAGSFLDIHDAIIGLMEPAEVDVGEVDGPDLITDLLEADPASVEERTLLVFDPVGKSPSTCGSARQGPV